MQYHSQLPNEVRFELLLQADIFTVLELCQEPIFKNVCSSDLFWLEKSKRDFNQENNKENYLLLYRSKLRKERDKIQEEIEKLLKQSYQMNNHLSPDQDLRQLEKIQKEIGLDDKIKNREDLDKKIKVINLNLQNGNILYIKRWHDKQQLTGVFSRAAVLKDIINATDKYTRERYTILIFNNSEASESARIALLGGYNFIEK